MAIDHNALQPHIVTARRIVLACNRMRSLDQPVDYKQTGAILAAIIRAAADRIAECPNEHLATLWKAIICFTMAYLKRHLSLAGVQEDSFGDWVEIRDIARLAELVESTGFAEETRQARPRRLFPPLVVSDELQAVAGRIRDRQPGERAERAADEAAWAESLLKIAYITPCELPELAEGGQ